MDRRNTDRRVLASGEDRGGYPHPGLRHRPQPVHVRSARGHGADGATVEARLIFRRAFQKLMEQKGWTDEDVLMEQGQVEVKAEAEAEAKVDTEAAAGACECRCGEWMQ